MREHPSKEQNSDNHWMYECIGSVLISMLCHGIMQQIAALLVQALDPAAPSYLQRNTYSRPAATTIKRAVVPIGGEIEVLVKGTDPSATQEL